MQTMDIYIYISETFSWSQYFIIVLSFFNFIHHSWMSKKTIRNVTIHIVDIFDSQFLILLKYLTFSLNPSQVFPSIYFSIYNSLSSSYLSFLLRLVLLSYSLIQPIFSLFLYPQVFLNHSHSYHSFSSDNLLQPQTIRVLTHTHTYIIYINK